MPGNSQMADAAHVVTHRAQPEPTHAKVPAPSRIKRMPTDAESLLEVPPFAVPIPM